MFWKLPAAALLLVATAGPVSAQVRMWYVPASPYGAGYGPYSGPYSGTGAYGQGTGTPLADVIRADGEFTLNRASSALTYEEARSRYIDNILKWQNAYFTYRRQGQGVRASRAQEQRAVRDRWLASGVTTGPARLTSTQLDPTTSRLYWPKLLQEPAFAAGREKLEQLFELRSTSRDSAGVSAEIRETARAMQAQLKLAIRDAVPSDYLEARRFLDSVAAESQFAFGT